MSPNGVASGKMAMLSSVGVVESDLVGEGGATENDRDGRAGFDDSPAGLDL